MAWDKNASPVGWYYGSYLLRFVELADKKRDNPERRFLAWENTVIVQAKSLNAAYTKVERIAKRHTKPYRGGPAPGVPVQWEYIGVTELLPIYEKLEDGAEISWTEHASRKLKTLKKWVKPKEAFHR
ncbi:MAG: DUF4288 domain-containing protein [Gallionellaceae bacterium]|jgi:hypothetical protein|nr:DUF4288 domain-containing protein [Gallionellaceae bacterium]